MNRLASPSTSDATPEVTDEQMDSEPTKPSKLLSLSTEAFCTDPHAERLGIVTGTCVYGQHVGRDIMAAWRDLTGGRAKAAETLFNDARQAALHDMSNAAAALGATRVFAVRIDHQELSGGGKSMVMVTAVGTAVRSAETA